MKSLQAASEGRSPAKAYTRRIDSRAGLALGGAPTIILILAVAVCSCGCGLSPSHETRKDSTSTRQPRMEMAGDVFDPSAIELVGRFDDPAGHRVCLYTYSDDVSEEMIWMHANDLSCSYNGFTFALYWRDGDSEIPVDAVVGAESMDRVNAVLAEEAGCSPWRYAFLRDVHSIVECADCVAQVGHPLCRKESDVTSTRTTPVNAPGDASPGTIAPWPHARPHAKRRDIVVYVTADGDEYHEAHCQHVRRSRTSIPLGVAKNRGYSPCQACGPPR